MFQYVNLDIATKDWDNFVLQEKEKNKEQLNQPQYLMFQDSVFGVTQANPRDSMVFCILDFQVNQQNFKTVFELVTKYLATLWGGKVVLLLPKEAMNIFLDNIDKTFGFTIKPNANNIIYFDKTALIKAFAQLESEEGYSKERKLRLKTQQQRFDSGELIFLDKENIKEIEIKQNINMDEKLYHFLANNAAFASDVTKLKIGLYSPAAMEQRRSLESVEVFLAYDPIQQQIMHSVYVNILINQEGVAQFVYLSDIVARGPKNEQQVLSLDQRNIGLSEVFFQKVYAAISDKYPTLQGAFVIAGGNGLSPRGAHLNLEVFGGINLNPNNQDLLSPPVMGNFAAFIRFFPMQGLLNGPLLVKAANRNEQTGMTLDPIIWPEDVLASLAKDQEVTAQLVQSGQGILSNAPSLPALDNNVVTSDHQLKK